MHDIAEQYYATVDAAMTRHSTELMAELLAAKVVFDALWVKRMRDFRGEVPPEEVPKREAPPEDQRVVDTTPTTGSGTSTSGSIVVHGEEDVFTHVYPEPEAGAS